MRFLFFPMLNNSVVLLLLSIPSLVLGQLEGAASGLDSRCYCLTISVLNWGGGGRGGDRWIRRYHSCLWDTEKSNGRYQLHQEPWKSIEGTNQGNQRLACSHGSSQEQSDWTGAVTYRGYTRQPCDNQSDTLNLPERPGGLRSWGGF